MVDLMVMVIVDSQYNDVSDDVMVIVVILLEFEIVNVESVMYFCIVLFVVEESVVKEIVYSIILLNVDFGDEIDCLISQIFFFEILVFENIVNVSVMFEGEEFILLIINQKVIFEVLLFLEDGEYIMDVKFIDKDDDFLIKEKIFLVDYFLVDIVNVMNVRGKIEDDINDFFLMSFVGYNNNGVIDVFVVNEVMLFVDN